jgi:NAD(P)-dependent dehydrogenase (short-subunit alcohol dehydrogenase family)
MRCLVIGATGTIGQAVADELAGGGHEVLRASRKGEIKVDIDDPASIRALYERIGKVDAVISCAGDAAFAPLAELSDEQIDHSLKSKMLGQVNLVRFGLGNMNDGGVFVLTAGMFSKNPMPGVPAISLVNGAIESFAIAAALDLPRGIRIGTLSPPFITETAQKMGMPTEGTLSAADNAKVYAQFVAGKETGKVIFTGEA